MEYVLDDTIKVKTTTKKSIQYSNVRKTTNISKPVVTKTCLVSKFLIKECLNPNCKKKELLAREISFVEFGHLVKFEVKYCSSCGVNYLTPQTFGRIKHLGYTQKKYSKSERIVLDQLEEIHRKEEEKKLLILERKKKQKELLV